MPGHAATGTDPGPQGVVRVEDDVHPSTEHLTENSRWTRNDEWYNFSNNVRGTAHVLATMDETTYAPGSNAMGYDHPISWCKPYEGGRFWGTAMGHFPSHYDEPDFMQHLVGGVKYVAGLEEGDCGGTVWDSFEKVSLDQNTSAPFAMDIAEDGRVFYTELVRGEIRVWDPRTQGVTTALTQDVYSGGEDGLLGIALHPDFATNGHVFVYMSPDAPDNEDPSSFKSQIARFTMDETGVFDPDSKKVIIEVPARRLPDEPGHTGGGLDFDAQGNLYLGVGDDVNPHSEPSGGYAPLSTRPGTFHDARETSANTNDLRGKLLRITPVADPTAPGLGTGYTIPEGNLFDEAERRRARQDPARDLRDGLPQPVPLLRSTRRPARSASPTTRPTTTTTPRRPVAPPASPSGTTSPAPATTAGRCAWATTSPSATSTTRPARSRSATTSTAPTRSTTRRATPA